jgi:hypothetical protein
MINQEQAEQNVVAPQNSTVSDAAITVTFGENNINNPIGIMSFNS